MPIENDVGQCLSGLSPQKGDIMRMRACFQMSQGCGKSWPSRCRPVVGLWSPAAESASVHTEMAVALGLYWVVLCLMGVLHRRPEHVHLLPLRSWPLDILRVHVAWPRFRSVTLAARRPSRIEHRSKSNRCAGYRSRGGRPWCPVEDGRTKWREVQCIPHYRRPARRGMVG